MRMSRNARFQIIRLVFSLAVGLLAKWGESLAAHSAAHAPDKIQTAVVGAQ